MKFFLGLVNNIVEINDKMLVSYNISKTLLSLTLSQRQILVSSKLKDFADDNFKADKSGRKFF